MTEVLVPDRHDPKWLAFCGDLADLIEQHGCRGGEDTRNARQLLREGGYDADTTLLLYRATGGYCDCEILYNTAWVAESGQSGLEVHHDA